MNPPSAEPTQKKRKLSPKQAGRLRAANTQAKKDEEKRIHDEFATNFLDMPKDIQASVIKHVPVETHKAMHAANRHFRTVTNKIQREPFKAIDEELYKLIPATGTVDDPYLEMYRLLSTLKAAQYNSGDQGFKNWGDNNRTYPYFVRESYYQGRTIHTIGYTPPKDAPENIQIFFKSDGKRTHSEMKALLLEAAYYVAKKKGIQTMFYPPKPKPKPNDTQLGQGRKTLKKRSTKKRSTKKRSTKKSSTLKKRKTLKKRRTLTNI
jgi:hypothetical protein